MKPDFEALCDPSFDGVRKRSYLALDVPSWAEAERIVDTLGEAVDGYKVGLQLFHADGTRTLDALRKRNKRVFLDMKLHDIPNTVAGALRAICDYDIEMVNVHASGGRKMMEAARNAVDTAAHRPLLIGVTALTSLSDDDLAAMKWLNSLDLVNILARATMEAGLDGVVASALDVKRIREWASSEFEIVVPGTRPAGVERNDQARSMTPGEAMRAGASRLVLGRAVTHSPNPTQALYDIWCDMRDNL